MKTYIIFTFFILNIIMIDSLFAQEKESVIISPLIGDKLDRVERDYFKLLPQINGFQEAEFYLNPDSSLNVSIVYEKDQQLRDTVLNNYKSLSRVQNHINQFLTYLIRDIKPASRGKFANVVLVDSSTIHAELMTVSENSLLVYDPEVDLQEKNVLSAYGIKKLNYTEINEIIVEDRNNVSLLIFPLAGATLGMIYYAANDNDPDPTLDELGEKLLGFIGSTLIGGLIGIALGYLIPIEVESEARFESPIDENDIKGLRENARHSKEIPLYLLKVE